jgi:hypothetical protein
MSSGLENGLTTQLEDAASTKPTGVRFPTRGYDDDWTRTLDAFEILATLGEGTFGYANHPQIWNGLTALMALTLTPIGQIRIDANLNDAF